MTDTPDLKAAERRARSVLRNPTARPSLPSRHVAVLLAEYHRRGERIRNLEGGREVEQHMLRNAALQVEEAVRQFARAADECDRRGAELAETREELDEDARAMNLLRRHRDTAEARCRDLEEELVAVRSQIDAVRALAEDAMKLPTIDDPRPADDRVSPRAVLAVLGEWPRSPVLPSGGRAPTCPGCDTQDSDGADGWVTHRGRPWHGACVAVQAAERAGLL